MLVVAESPAQLIDLCSDVFTHRLKARRRTQFVSGVHYNYRFRRQQDVAIRTYRNAVFIYNPVAGGPSGKHADRISRAVATLRQAGHRIEIAPTGKPGDATRIAREAVRRGADLVLVAGGDGTLNEAINGVAGSEAPVGMLPTGTANVLGCELRLGGFERAVASVGAWIPRRVALGSLRAAGLPPRYFLLMAGAGLDAHIANNVNRSLKRRSGKFSYWVSGAREFTRRLGQFDARAGDVARRCGFALASRVRNYGGTLEIARTASLASDEFEVVLFEGANPPRYLKYLAGAVTGALRTMKGITIVKARRLELLAPDDPPVYVQVDGEVAGRLPAMVEIVPDALTLLVPEDFHG